MASRFGVGQLPCQVCYNVGEGRHLLPGNVGLPAHSGQVTTRGLQEWLYLLPQEVPFATAHMMLKKLLPAGDTKPSAHTHTGLFGTQHLHGRLYPLPLHLASFRAYASIALLPAQLQGLIPSPWLTVTWVGLSPTRLRGLARPQPWSVPIIPWIPPLTTY